jgi:Ser/Thr protein kinase RdoA (MazF antagonist)
MSNTIPSEVLQAFDLAPTQCEPIHSNINRTWVLTDTTRRAGSRVLLQRLHPVFGATVNADLETVTEHLASHGLETPRLIRPTAGGTHVVDGAGQLWRLQSFIEGLCFATAENAEQLASAARLLALFHRALVDLTKPLLHHRPLHDTRARLNHLGAVLSSEQGRRDRIAQDIGNAILEHATGAQVDFSAFPHWLRHGDPKLSNILFFSDRPTQALCFVDLDTVSPGPLAHELGDALRSWCNRAGEDSTEPEIPLEYFDAALRGYAEGCTCVAPGLAPLPLTPHELESAVYGFETLCVELASRFAADLIDDSYWGWDERRFASRHEHNRVRALSQLGLARGVRARRDDLLRRARAAGQG